jgi:hypothetical protein
MPYRFNTDKDLFLYKVTATVQESLKRVYDSQSSSCSIVFTESKPAHEELIRGILLNGQSGVEREELFRGADEDLDAAVDQSAEDSLLNDNDMSQDSMGNDVHAVDK